jgi:LysM repeat protein
MKNMLFRTLPLFAVVAFSGCETMYNNSGRRQEADNAAMRAAMERQQLSRDTEIAKAAAQSAEVQLQQLDMRLSRLEDSLRQSQNASGADLAALQREIASLKGEISAIRADRETMKKEIVNQISSEVAKLLAAQQQKAAAAAAAARAEAQSQSGYEHKVQSGQTLSAIAQAYGVSVEKIKRANNLKNDVIRVGQTLFIPD